MARKAVVNKDVILGLLREGETTQRIAQKFNVSRQAIDIYRKEFIKKGLLPNQRAVRKRNAKEQTVPAQQNLTSSNKTPVSKDIITLDEQIELIISAFNALKRLPQLEKEVENYKHEYHDALQEIERLKEKENKRLDQESRWIVTQSKSEPKPT
ncbi:MAG: helix-turn-helix domain-containing protein [Chloroflexota bacterium]